MAFDSARGFPRAAHVAGDGGLLFADLRAQKLPDCSRSRIQELKAFKAF
jgi:hypothetical protein